MKALSVGAQLSLMTDEPWAVKMIRILAGWMFYYVALKPPSRFRTQLFAKRFVARKIAASATSSGCPTRREGQSLRYCCWISGFRSRKEGCTLTLSFSYMGDGRLKYAFL